MFVLDTNVVSEMRTGKRQPSFAVRQWAARQSLHSLYIAAVTVFELELGVLSMERKDPRQGRILRAWLETVLADFSPRVLPFSEATAVLCAAMHVPNRRPERDAMIAATAKQFGYTMATRNTADFVDCGVSLINPWLP